MLGGTHWWSILDIEPKTDIFFFDSFGIDGLKHFIKQDDRKIIEKILFGIEKMTRTVNIWMVEDRVQDLNSATCGISQLYFYDNLFNPNENSKIQDMARLNKKSIGTLLNELFFLDDQDENEETIKQYARNIGIVVT